MKTAPARQAAVALSGALLLSSCGSLPVDTGFLKGHNEFLDQSPRNIAKTSFAAMQDVTSMRILGDVDDKLHGRMQIDLSVGRAGCQGSVEIDDKGGFHLRHNQDGTWMQVDQNFWLSQAGSLRRGDQTWRAVRGKWLVMDDEDLLELCDLEVVLAQFDLEPEDTEETFQDEDVVEVGDSEAVPITAGEGRQRTIIWVSLDDPHLALKMAPARDKGLPDALFFEEFDAKLVVETPTSEEVFELPSGQSFL